MKNNKKVLLLLLSCVVVSSQAMSEEKMKMKAEKAKIKLQKSRERAGKAIARLVKTVNHAKEALSELQEARIDFLQGIFNSIQEKTMGEMIPGLEKLSNKIVKFRGRARKIPAIGMYKLKYAAQSLEDIKDKVLLRAELKLLLRVKNRVNAVKRLVKRAMLDLERAESKMLKGERYLSSYEILEDIVRSIDADLGRIETIREKIQDRMKELKK